MKVISGREQRLVAIALLLLLIFGFTDFAIMPLIEGFVTRAQSREDLMAQYARNDRVLAGLPGWRLQAQAQLQTVSRFAIIAPTMAVGMEMLKQRVTQDVRAAGASPQAFQPTEADIPKGWIGVRGDLQLTLSQLDAMLIRLQNEEPYVVIDYLSIAALGNQQPGEPQTLAVRIALSSPLRLDPPSSKPGATAGHA